IPAGLKVGIVGASGSGKSTLSKLIQCMYKPLEGRILIDGVDVAQVEPAWLRRQIGVVLQENRLFAGTIRENISVAVPGASMEEIEKAAELADAAAFIKDMPDGYDTFVGEGGGLLSGGQRQRIALARALMTNPKILIMDEATSALDSRTEKHVIANLHQIARGRTMLMIAHRLATVKDCDAIIVMEHGHIVEAGPHEELMRRKGAYYRLWQGTE
ncbi:MAG: ATP-binding cassette domain-containing protein, partial [Pseudobutyrivibrio sp.]|nr:ATP-binding cassette domain-containing protein [Pseudobutyrivibrio sp.]